MYGPVRAWEHQKGRMHPVMLIRHMGHAGLNIIKITTQHHLIQICVLQEQLRLFQPQLPVGIGRVILYRQVMARQKTVSLTEMLTVFVVLQMG